ncbi:MULTISPECIES: glucose-6-phosphate isomerase [unclassified Mycoplasma]|uniref:glucose-6-phosphate isomerase n=1 Tax=unclassified Mycoplasma TaxID=2683645 RepID=UPI00211B87E6|nr:MULTISPECIES: glucose-6-phosphate isomerase [unclassified Mycoplasma]UUM20038.1 glucose-6-phosphate isomerase [Mycoplasma sp. 1578d]UUM25018.1 glucose-6-phosphate isomerase [Mycoplasma sp. 3686d]
MSLKYLNLNTENALKNASSELSFLQAKISQIHHDVKHKTVAEKEWLGWYDLPSNYGKTEVELMHQKAAQWEKSGVEVVVVIGIGGSYLGAKTGYEFIYGPYANKKPRMELLFAGNDLSASALVSKLNYVKDKKFAINVISKSGTTLEPSVAFREFRMLLEAQIKKQNLPIEEAANLIVATTDKDKGLLNELATQKGYMKLIVPDDVGGRFSVLTAVGLFPFVCAGINVEQILQGASETNEQLNSDLISQNPAYLYAALRYYLHVKQKYMVELFVSYEPKLQYFTEWWKQLFGESEGKDGKGLWPASALYSTDLHSIGQMVQDGSKILFETVVSVQDSHQNITLQQDFNDPDKLGYLNDKDLHSINNTVLQATICAHANVGNVPNLHLTIKDFSEQTLGALFIFFERAVTMSAYLLGVNPFNQPGVEVYKKNMFELLKK